MRRRALGLVSVPTVIAVYVLVVIAIVYVIGSAIVAALT